LYVGDENVNANEVDFKKAFELISHLQAEEPDTEEEVMRRVRAFAFLL